MAETTGRKRWDLPVPLDHPDQKGNQGNLVQKETKGFPAEMEARDLRESKAKKDKTGNLG